MSAKNVSFFYLAVALGARTLAHVDAAGLEVELGVDPRVARSKQTRPKKIES